MLGSALGPLRPPGIQDTSGRLVSVPSAGENIRQKRRFWWCRRTKRRSLWTEYFKLKHDWKLFLEQLDAKKVSDTFHVCHKFQTKIVFDDCLS